MNEKETGMLLADVARRDKREPSLSMLAMWHDALSDIGYDEAKEALRILNRETTDYLMPAHVREAVKRVRAARRRPSVAALRSRWEAVKACELCDEHGYRLPKRLSLCSHRAPSAIGAAAQVRRMLEAGDAS